MTKPTDVEPDRSEGPPIFPDVDDIVYRAKYANAIGTQLLSSITYRIARLAQAGRLDRDEATGLQIAVAYVWHALHEGTMGAVRDRRTDWETWADADNTYPDGSTVTAQQRIEPWAVSVQRNYIPFVWGNGATNAHMPGTVSHISPPSNGTGWDEGQVALQHVKWLEGDIHETDASAHQFSNTYSDGRQVMAEVRVKNWYELDLEALIEQARPGARLDWVVDHDLEAAAHETAVLELSNELADTEA